MSRRARPAPAAEPVYYVAERPAPTRITRNGGSGYVDLEYALMAALMAGHESPHGPATATTGESIHGRPWPATKPARESTPPTTTSSNYYNERDAW